MEILGATICGFECAVLDGGDGPLFKRKKATGWEPPVLRLCWKRQAYPARIGNCGAR